ncbi:hypothetical protein C5167_034343 [Papaver somniferum]|uniref:Uncharacterized protein n=1 Tax=Papaver somniferum TaxID=3469 RepID=A0A4Y7KGY5_PAPSO|nr:hypothetical protein C5167_034343 [Papaver somniferum]
MVRQVFNVKKGNLNVKRNTEKSSSENYIALESLLGSEKRLKASNIEELEEIVKPLLRTLFVKTPPSPPPWFLKDVHHERRTTATTNLRFQCRKRWFLIIMLKMEMILGCFLSITFLDTVFNLMDKFIVSIKYGKNDSKDLFDILDSNKLNAHLKEHMLASQLKEKFKQWRLFMRALEVLSKLRRWIHTTVDGSQQYYLNFDS